MRLTQHRSDGAVMTPASKYGRGLQPASPEQYAEATPAAAREPYSPGAEHQASRIDSPDAAAAAAAAATARAVASVRLRTADQAPAARPHGAGRMSKYGSDAGLHGVAEAAGHMLAELKSSGEWWQGAQGINMAARIALGFIMGYVLLLAPARLGWKAEAHLVRTFGAENALLFALINLLGFFPAILGCVAWPLLRSHKHKVKLWRYILASTMTGAFALLSYLARWEPPRGSKVPHLPPHQLTGRTRWLQRAYESRAWPAMLLAGTLSMLSFALVASPATWAHFGYLATHSFTVNVMLLDFTLLTVLSPWLVIQDAVSRGWAPARTTRGRIMIGAAVLLAPAVGPGVYLLLRPISRAGGVFRKGWTQKAMKMVKELATYPFKLPEAIRGSTDVHHLAGHGRPAGSATTASEPRHGMQGSTEHRPLRRRTAGAAQGSLAARTAEAAAVPLPTAAQATVSASQQLVEQWWHDGWAWLGQRVARMRGGGTPVASQDEAAGDELDVNGNDGGFSDDTPHSGSHFNSPLPQHHQEQQKQWRLGPTAPIKGRDLTLGLGEVYMFGNDYDEYEFDYDNVTTSDDVSDDDLEDYDTDDDDNTDDDEAVQL